MGKEVLRPSFSRVRYSCFMRKKQGLPHVTAFGRGPRLRAGPWAVLGSRSRGLPGLKEHKLGVSLGSSGGTVQHDE